jgi:phenylalanyl-tRNA synthetase alpha chain
MKAIGALPKEERSEAGKVLNELRSALTDAFEARREALAAAERQARLHAACVDTTLPAVDMPMGSRHPITAALAEMRAILRGMGFAEATGPEVESDEYNFERLNIPADHPARDMWDTFWTTDGAVLRTHTSPVQIHVMERSAPDPVKIICPGRVFRYEQVTARSECMFHQIEGLEIGPHVTFTELLGVLQGFARRMFGPSRRIRVRNSYFPFTEPSIEVDVDCFRCNSKGCSLCKQTGWVEILGAGMVHPNVLRSGGYDPDEVSGFAFGMGVERIVLMRYGIDDIRHFYRNDLRFLTQFRAL